MRNFTTDTLRKGALPLLILSTAILIGSYALLTSWTVDTHLPVLACTESWEIEHQENNGDIVVPAAGVKIGNDQSLGNVVIEQFTESVIVNDQRSVGKVLGIHPDRNEQLAATISFQYQEEDLGDLSEEDLILYSSQDDGRSWQAHYNSIVDPVNNSIHLSEVEHFSLWTAAPSDKAPEVSSTASAAPFNQPALPSATSTTINAGAYIINMGVQPQTVGNALKPYGLVYTLLREYQVPVEWVINPNKAKDGIDFTYNGIGYKGGPFIIRPEFRNATVNALIASWEAQGVVGVTTTSQIVVPVYRTLSYFMYWTLDAGNGGIAEGYLQNAGIPEDGYNWVEVGDLTCCDDIFVMPHADPEWNDGVLLQHGRLFTWNQDIGTPDGCNGSIWAACHAVSALELMFNPNDPTQQTNFLSTKTGTAMGGGPYATPNNSLVEWGDHGEAAGPYSYFNPTHPVMQFLGIMDAAMQNGSEQSYMPVIGAQWRPTTVKGITIPSHPDKPSLTLDPIKMVFGDAFGDPTRGKVMYEAGHTHNGSAPANVAAQRAFFNFSFWAIEGKAITVDIGSVPETLEGGSDVVTLTATATGGTGVYEYQWVSECPGTFSNPVGQTTTFTPDFVSEGVNCAIKCIVMDDCGTRSSFDSRAVTIVPAPVPPVANNDSEFTNPAVPVTLSPLDNDTDLNLDIDPSTLTFWDSGAGTPIGSTFDTGNGTFTINFDGTVTYVSNPGFMGVETIDYQICDETEAVDGGPFCDVATITIIIDETDEFGCTPLQEYRKLYTAYGTSESSNAFVSSPFFALGYPEGRAVNKPANLNANADLAQRGVMTFSLDALALAGDVVKIYGWSQDGNPTTFSVSSSSDGATFSNVQGYTVPNDDVSYTFDYTVTDPDGIFFIRVTNTNSSKAFRLDGISYEVKSCQEDCVLPEVPLVLNGTASNFDAASTAANEARALGLPNLDGADIDPLEYMILDLGDTIPNGSQVQLFLANDSQSPEPTVDVSAALDYNPLLLPDLSAFTGTVNFEPTTDKDEQYSQFFYTVTAPNGARYLAFEGLVNKVFVDAVIYEIETCISAVPTAVDDVTFTLEGVPVTYDVQGNDFDPLGSPLTTTLITSDPSNGTATINPDGTITYVPNADFNGTDVLTYQICNDEGLCDEATLTITIPDDGCSDPGETLQKIGISYAIAATDPGNNVNNELNATYYPDGVAFAEMDNPTEELVLELSDIVQPGDVIRFYVSASNANVTDFTVEVSTDGSTVIDPVSYSVSGTAFVEFEYQVNATGIDFIHFTNDDPDDRLRVDGVLFNIWACAPACSFPPNTAITGDGFAVSATGARSPANAAGTPDLVAQEIRNGDSPATIVDLGEIVPQGTYIYLYLARNNADPVTVNVESSPTNGSFANLVSFMPTTASPNFQQYSFQVAPMSGIRYLRLNIPTSNRYFVDAVGYFYALCQDGTPVAVDDMTVTSEETPVTYAVLDNDTDPSGEALSTTQIMVDPTNGTAVINPDGTITYTPDPEFIGTEMLTYEVCNPFGLCDVAVLTIEVYGDPCAAGESNIIVGTGYAYSQTNTAVGNPDNAIGTPNATVAALNEQNDILSLNLNNTVAPGDQICFYVAGENAKVTDYTLSFSTDGITYGNTKILTITGAAIRQVCVQVDFAGGASYIRFTNTDATGDNLTVDAVQYNIRDCVPSGCVVSETPFVQTGFVPVGGGVSGTRNFTDLEGAPNSVGNEIRLGDAVTIVDFGRVLPQGTRVILYLARNGTNAVTLQLQSSLSNGSYANPLTFMPTSPNANFQQHAFTVSQVSGLQFLELSVTAGDRVFIDAIQYSIYQSNSLGGYVWDDSADEDGLFDAGEAAFAGVQVKIYRDVDASGTVNAGDVLVTTKTTDANGFYSYQFFAGTLPKNYVLVVDESTLPATPTNNYYTTAQYQTATLTSASDSDCENNFGRAFDNPPVAVDDVAATEQGVPITIDVFGNDENPDVDGETTTVTSITSPPSVGGTVSINPDGTVNYTPPGGFTGTETFEYELCDSADPGVLCDTATVTVTVDPFTNDPPVAVDDSGTTEQDMPISVNVLDNDSDPEGDFLTVSCVGTDASAASPGICDGMTDQGGTVIILPSGEIYYTPPAGYTGPDQTTYVICDPSGLCDEAVIDLTVLPDMNTPPIATDDPNVVIYQPCGATTFSVIDNDYDLDGDIDPATVTITMPLSPATGTLVNNMDGTFTYTPVSGGTFTFEYQVCDTGTPLPAECDVATVTMTVEASNDPPVAVDDADVISAGQDLTTGVLNNDSDPNGDDLIVTLCDPNNPTTACGLASSTSTQGGTVIVLPSGKTRYTPPAGFAGTDTYFYQICDDTCPGQQLCDFATVTVTVENQPPVAVNDAASTAINTLVNIPVLPNDFDPEGQTITVQSGGDNPTTPTGNGTTQGGSVTLLGDGTFDYTPPMNFIGQDTFYYEICDANAFEPQCDVAQVIVTVTSPIDVELVKTGFPLEPDAGDNVTFTLTISNNSAVLATGVVVRDKLPSGLTYVSDNGGGTYDEASGIWFVGNIAAGGSKSLQIVATVINFTDATNVAEVTDHDQVDTDSTPNNGILAEDDQSAVILQCVLKIAPIGVSPN